MTVASHGGLLCRVGPDAPSSQEEGGGIGVVPEQEGNEQGAPLVHLRPKAANLSNNAQVTARDPAAGYVDPERFDQIAWRALQEGGRKTGPISFEWDASAGCEQPVYRLFKARRRDPGFRDERLVQPDEHMPQRYMDMYVSCRKCPACLRKKAAHWRLRMIEELRRTDEVGARTWRGTLTLNPYHRALAQMIARKKHSEEEIAAMSPERRTAILANAFQPYVTRYLKRVRAQTGAGLRYISVTEPHKDGTPHWHMLVHEVASETPIRHAALAQQWAHGFSNWKLVDSAGLASAYPAKYLSKYPSSRVRASVGYGQGQKCDLKSRERSERERENVDPQPTQGSRKAPAAGTV